MALAQQLHVDARLVIIAFDEARGAELDEVLVTLLGFAQQNQVRASARRAVETAARRNIDLAPDHRMDSRLVAGLIEIHHAVHHAVVGDGQRLHAQFLGAIHQRA